MPRPPAPPSAPVGRGGLKLEAAVERFGLAPAVRGARAVDVGASTGGFTEVLLAHGAAHVVAVDVGHDQLHPRLRQDPRVEALERADWKRLALDVAPGPFDLFTVDVSFVAARNMLRSLAFRLRPGAEGVVLVKPQFELPSAQVRGGDVSDPALRARAVTLFREKAEALGFRIVQYIDSPVAGGSGTVEILTHLRFEGRSEKLPAPGEKRPVRPAARAIRGLGDGPQRWFAVAAPGLEPAVHQEVAALAGVTDVRLVEGGVEFTGPLATGLRANLHLRVATRVLLRVGRIRARDFAPLRHALAKLPWRALLPAEGPVRVTASASRCRLYHTGALAETVLLGIGDALGRKVDPAPKHPPDEGPEDRSEVGSSERRGKRTEAGAGTPTRTGTPTGETAADHMDGPAHERAREAAHRGAGEGPPDDTDALARPGAPLDAEPALHAGEAPDEPLPPLVLLRGREDEWTVSLDSSGERLHRRGYRLEIGKAPLRETLAAGALALCGHDPALPFVDGMCGSGTLVIEAAERALARAPGRGRTFAFERWPAVPAPVWQAVQDEARRQERSAPLAPIFGFDQDPRAIDRARRNAERAGLAAHVSFAAAPFGSRAAPGPAGLVLMNPPYGHRLGTRAQTDRLYRDVSRALRAQHRGWRVGLFAPDARLAAVVGLPLVAAHRLSNGGLPIHLLVFEVR